MFNKWLKRREENPKLPETFEEAVEFVANRIENDTVEKPFFHMTGGMAVRNSLGLWNKESALYQHMQQRFGLCHADDTGSLITSAAHAKRNGIPYDPTEDIEKFKRHWQGMGYDPATMEKVHSPQTGGDSVRPDHDSAGTSGLPTTDS